MSLYDGAGSHPSTLVSNLIGQVCNIYLILLAPFEKSCQALYFLQASKGCLTADYVKRAQADIRLSSLSSIVARIGKIP